MKKPQLINEQLKRMQKLAGIINESQEEIKEWQAGSDEELDQIEDEQHEKIHKLLDNPLFQEYSGLKGDDDFDEYRKKYNDEDTDIFYEEYCMKSIKEDDAQFYNIRNESNLPKKMKKSVLKEAIKRIIKEEYEEENINEKKLAKDNKPEEEEIKDDVDVEEPKAQSKKPSNNGGGDTKEIADLLQQAYDKSKSLNDDKLLHQLGNTITFFNKKHLLNVDGEN